MSDRHAGSVHRDPDGRTVVEVLELHRTSPSWTPPASSRHRTAPRLALVTVLVPVVFTVLLPWWIRAETAVVGRVLAALGVDVRRTGPELLLHDGGDSVVLVVIGWCSSLGPVLALIGVAWALPGSVRARWRALLGASALVGVGNLVRLSAVGWVAARWAPTAVDGFHDGPATAFAVVVVLLAAAVVVLGPPWRTPRPATGER